MKLIIVLCGLLIGTLSARACELSDPHCIPENSWRIAVAVGAGVKINPLHDGNNIPLVVIPDIAWYGESAYFDNGELGYQWQPTEAVSWETFITINSEKAYFSFWHPSNLLFSTSNITMGMSPSVQPERRVSYKDIANRRWAVDAGVRIHQLSDSGEWSASLLSDISNTYQGYQLNLGYQHAWKLANWRIAAATNLRWKSHQLLDYYYGLSERDKVSSSLSYRAGSGWFPSVSVLASRPLSQRWHWIIKASYQHLPDAMTNSPIVDNNSVISGFIGAAYQF